MSTTTCPSDLAQEEILDHLHAVLADRRFASAERNANFLRYVVESTLEGRAGDIKETVIATEVYGRSTDYDPKADSIVRVEASRLRQKLRSYYENEGRSAKIRFHLPSGTYVPQFEHMQPAETVVPEADASPEPPAASSQISAASAVDIAASRTRWLGPLAAAALLATLILIPLSTGAKSTGSADAEATAAWKEGAALLQQDPHTGMAERGAPKTLLRAIERLEFAVARDPKSARAWATLAEAYDYAFAYVGRDQTEDMRRAETAARKAIQLDENLAAGHHMLGLVLGFLKWDLDGAERAYKRALTLDPQNADAVAEYADLLRETGRVAEAAETVRKARALLPALPLLLVKEAEIQLDLGRPDAAMTSARSAVELKQNSLRAHLVLGMAYEGKGDIQQAILRYEHVLQVNPFDRRALPAYGYLLARAGRTDQAREVVRRLEQMNSTLRNCAFQVAVVYAGLGKQETTLAWLDRAWRTHQAHFPFAAVEPRFRGLHDNQRFRELISRVGLKPVG